MYTYSRSYIRISQDSGDDTQWMKPLGLSAFDTCVHVVLSSVTLPSASCGEQHQQQSTFLHEYLQISSRSAKQIEKGNLLHHKGNYSPIIYTSYPCIVAIQFSKNIQRKNEPT